ncbi:outer membrane beta-barrel protein [Catenovulum sp. SM1970]|uniref:outer membrane beta-barrel protein n=1 Tax=Marinifaba aquimaris TaxID=2741323 RepID=UPI001571A890|nr:outer membrane beta-barrel protein [Marinifaba aquimaris]NTS78205.1 outer membrane beta-barrel protein [Marinifaba aquimaris]
MNIKITALAFASSLLLTAQVQAKEDATEGKTGFYAGFGLSSVSADESGVSSDEIGFSVLGGYTFSPYLSTEMSLFNIGDHQDLGIEGHGISLSAIGSYPVTDDISIFVEFGGMTVDVEVDEAKNLSYSNTNGDDEESLEDGQDSSLFYGVGIKYQFDDSWTFALRQSTADLDADMEFYSIQAHYNF